MSGGYRELRWTCPLCFHMIVKKNVRKNKEIFLLYEDFVVYHGLCMLF